MKDIFEQRYNFHNNMLMLSVSFTLFYISIVPGLLLPALYLTGILIISGNQQRLKLIRDNIFIRRMCYFCLVAPYIYYGFPSKTVNISTIELLVLTSLSLLIVIGYQLRSNWTVITKPSLVFFIYNDFSYNKFNILFSVSMAIIEELFFRVVIGHVNNWDMIDFTIVSTSLFLIYHLASPWSQKIFTPKDVINQLLFSFLFCIVYFITRNAACTIILHVVFNLFSNMHRFIYIFIGWKDEIS